MITYPELWPFETGSVFSSNWPQIHSSLPAVAGVGTTGPSHDARRKQILRWTLLTPRVQLEYLMGFSQTGNKGGPLCVASGSQPENVFFLGSASY